MTLRILVADDDLLIRKLMNRLLKPWGKIVVAASGDEAEEIWLAASDKGKPFGLVCLDIKMPGKHDGQQALKVLRDSEEAQGIFGLDRCKVIMTTGYRDAENVMDSFRSQVDAYLVKPINPEFLYQTLSDLGLQKA